MTRPRTLGGVFGLEHPCASARSLFRGRRVQYFLSVRCALKALVEAHRPGTVWLPSYVCGSILTPFLESNVRFYSVDERLSVARNAWIEEIRPGDLVLVIHYFGFPNLTFPAREVAGKRALLVEDASQALFLEQQFPESTCILYSPRKFLGVPDAGVMVSDRETGTEPLELQPPPLDWWSSAVEMSLSRREYDLTGRPNDWFAKFQRVESEYPVGLFRASDLSRMLLHAVDYDAIRNRRRENYQRLRELVGDFAVFRDLGPVVVPLGFPVRVESTLRDQVLAQLHVARIYAPVHWRIDHIPSRSVMTLLCDQRCTLDDIEAQARAFLSALALP